MNRPKPSKYTSVELALYELKRAGYTIKDTVYRALVRERTLLELNKDSEHKEPIEPIPDGIEFFENLPL